jgi:methyl-accepting chemotaxis protein
MQALMRQFSIRTRMMGAIAIVLLLLGVVGSAGLWGMWRLHQSSEGFVEHTFAEMNALSRLKVALSDLGRHERDMVISYEAPEEAKRAQAAWLESRSRAEAEVALLLNGGEDKDNEVLRKMQGQMQAYMKAAEPVVNQVVNGGYDTATVAQRMLTRARGDYAAMQESLDRVTELLRQEADAANQANAQASNQALLVFGVVLAVAALVVVPSTLANMQSICGPVNEARRLASAISGGDLTSKVNVQGKDELADLMRDLDTMQTSLARIVGEVRHSTESIGTASSQIASGNQDLSHRTEQTASSLQQTAASVEQINGMVRQSADAARQASDMAVANAQVAARGGEVVGQVVATMQEIQDSSRRIGDIIGVIDGIAFQTNILALNAAVEAARAGEQGRGFAVVAGEVRSLAQRSAEAAKEIKSLIGTSVDRVAVGTALVSEAGQTIGEIVSNADRISSFIGDITVAAQEQSGGIGQVNSAVGRLDEMTQQNAALVEESAAAAESLREQAQRLSELVQVFRLSV